MSPLLETFFDTISLNFHRNYCNQFVLMSSSFPFLRILSILINLQILLLLFTTNELFLKSLLFFSNTCEVLRLPYETFSRQTPLLHLQTRSSDQHRCVDSQPYENPLIKLKGLKRIEMNL